MGQRSEWVIHVWGRKRKGLQLTDVEKFHINMLKMYQDQQKKFDKISIHIALEDVGDTAIYELLKNEIDKVIVIKNVEYWLSLQNPELKDLTTFKAYVSERIGEDVNVFYSHFKGYGTSFKPEKESYPIRVVQLCEMFWSYIMYRYSLTNWDLVEDKLKDHSVFCWYASNKQCPGRFAWYNLKRLGDVLETKSDVTDIIGNLSDGECYSLKDYENIGNLYTSIYPSKKIGREFLKDFEKYLIDNELI